MIKTLTLVALVLLDDFTAGGAVASHHVSWSIWAVLLWVATAAYVTIWAAHRERARNRL